MKSKSTVIIEEKIESISCSTKLVGPNTLLESYPTSKKPIMASKSQNDPKIKSKSNARIEGNKENKKVALYE